MCNLLSNGVLRQCEVLSCTPHGEGRRSLSLGLLSSTEAHAHRRVRAIRVIYEELQPLRSSLEWTDGSDFVPQASPKPRQERSRAAAFKPWVNDGLPAALDFASKKPRSQVYPPKASRRFGSVKSQSTTMRHLSTAPPTACAVGTFLGPIDPAVLLLASGRSGLKPREAPMRYLHPVDEQGPTVLSSQGSSHSGCECHCSQLLRHGGRAPSGSPGPMY